MYTKNNALSQLITVTGPKKPFHFSELSAHDHLICPFKNETATSGIPEAARHHSDLDIIRPEYSWPSGFAGV